MRIKNVTKKFKITGKRVECTMTAYISAPGGGLLKESFPKKIIASGSANCNVGDVFNEELGKKISGCRAKVALYSRIQEVEREYQKKLNKLREEFEGLSSNAESNKKKERNYIAKITG